MIELKDFNRFRQVSFDEKLVNYSDHINRNRNSKKKNIICLLKYLM